jgi:hypothetical protein
MAGVLSRSSGIAFVLLGLVTGASAKPSCAVVGDSIAVAAGQHMGACRVNAKIGIQSKAVIARVNSFADVNVVSAGSNDPANPHLRTNLESIRSRAHRVIWILPIDGRARAEVRAVAIEHGDPVVSFTPAGDRVHPGSDVALARSIAAVMDARPAKLAPSPPNASF